MKFSRQLILVFSLAISSVVITGCATNEPTATELDFGNSVRAMQRAQMLNPQEALLPDPNPVDHGDGVRLNNVLEVYQTGVSTPDQG